MAPKCVTEGGADLWQKLDEELRKAVWPFGLRELPVPSDSVPRMAVRSVQTSDHMWERLGSERDLQKSALESHLDITYVDRLAAFASGSQRAAKGGAT
jgi:hypothetical protein